MQVRAKENSRGGYIANIGLKNCVLFIEENIIGKNRLGGHNIFQRVCYNAYIDEHALIYQGPIEPDKLCLHLYGPEVTGCHSMFIFGSSELDEKVLGTSSS